MSRCTTSCAGCERLAWAAGVLDSGGSSTPRDDGARRVQLKRHDRALLDRLAGTIGGKVYGPYAPGGPRREYFVWASDGMTVAEVVDMLRPWLSPERIESLLGGGS